MARTQQPDSPAPALSLLTDFGQKDAFVGIMKGVLLSLAPGVPLVDLTHALLPGDIVAGAVQLTAAVPWFPPGLRRGSKVRVRLRRQDAGSAHPQHAVPLKPVT